MDRNPGAVSAVEGLTAIDGLVIQPLAIKRDGRGAVMHMLRADSPLFEQFGEVYFSLVKSGVTKGWKRHRVMTQHFAVPVGDIRLAVFDDRPDSPTRGQTETLEIGIRHYCLVKIPPGLWYGFQGVSSEDALIVNCATHVHDPAESETRPLDDPPDAGLIRGLGL